MFKKKKEGFVLDSCSSMKNKNVDMIASMSSSSDDNHIVLTVSMNSKFPNIGIDSQYGSSAADQPQGSLELVIFNSSLVNTIKNSSMEPFEFMYQHGSYSQGISGLVVLPSKSIAATMGRDKSLKLW